MDWSASVSLKTTGKSFSVQNVHNYGSFTNAYGMKKSKSLEFRIPQSIPEHSTLYQFASPGKQLRDADAARAAGENNNYWMQQRAKMAAGGDATNGNGFGSRKRKLGAEGHSTSASVMRTLWRNRKSAALACSVPVLLVVVFVILLFWFPAGAVEVAVASGSSSRFRGQPAPPSNEATVPSDMPLPVAVADPVSSSNAPTVLT